MLNNVYQIIQQQNSQALADRLTLIGENIHNVNPRNNILQEATSHKTIIPELMRDPKEVHKSPSLCHNTVLIHLVLKEGKVAIILMRLTLLGSGKCVKKMLLPRCERRTPCSLKS